MGRCPRFIPAARLGFLRYWLLQKHKSRPPHRARPHFTAFQKCLSWDEYGSCPLLLIKKLRAFKNKPYVFKCGYFHTCRTPLQNTHIYTRTRIRKFMETFVVENVFTVEAYKECSPLQTKGDTLNTATSDGINSGLLPSTRCVNKEIRCVKVRGIR